MAVIAGALAAIACAAAGVLTLRGAWRRRGGAPRTAAGWALLAAGLPAWALTGAAPDKAGALTALAPSLVALAVLACGVRLHGRGGRAATAVPSPAPAPAPAPGRAVRAGLRAVLAGPFALWAAAGVAALVALHGPGGEADRFVAAGFVLPLAWGAAAVWATTDAHLARVAAGLGLAGAAGLLAARL